MGIKLDIGCGDQKRDGFLGVDAYVETDIRAEMWNIPLADGSVDEIWSCHALEHVSKFEVVPTLQEWHRLLKLGGQAVIEVPDLEWCCKNWLWRRSTDWHLDVLFGMQNHPGEFHKTGFTVEIMLDYLQQAGLHCIRHSTVESHGQPTLHFEVQKS